MFQAIVKKGKVFGEEVPAPKVSERNILVKVVSSCISAGTETAGIKYSGDALIKRALKQPENVRKVIDMAKSDHIANVYRKVKSKVSEGRPTGYSLSGVVIATGNQVRGFKVGDKVAAAGAGIANHAEYVDVPENLLVKMPIGLSFFKASTVTLGAIAMQGVRRADLKMGEFAVVYGAGLIGLLTIQMLRISGIRVAAIDIDEKRLEIASEVGARVTVNPKNDDSIATIMNWSNGFGADAVIFTAATKSSDPLSQSLKMCRKKGSVIIVGGSGMEIKREDMYVKELDLLMSTSYGPGRYDPNYEEKGLDYPYGYVRWTENRNMVEYLRLLNKDLINLDKLLFEKYPIQNVSEAFEILQNSEKRPLSVILDYGDSVIENHQNQDRKILLNDKPIKNHNINIALIGSGNFAVGMHLPNIKKLSNKFTLYAVMNKTGYKGKVVAQQYGARYVTTEYNDILNDERVDLVFITTRHDSHAELVLKSLKAGKNTFVEKPLAVKKQQLEDIKLLFENCNSPPVLMVGFNRRFSKYAKEIKNHTDRRINPLYIHYRMNAGHIPLDHWIHENGGRIIGEACHIIDLMTYFTGCRITAVSCDELSPKTDAFSSSDNKSIILKYEDGSIASIDYFAVGNNRYPKEYMEVHFDQKTIVLDNYKLIKGYGVKIKELSSKNSQKGQLEELEHLHQTLINGGSEWPIPFWDMIQTTAVSFLLK